MAGQGLCRIGAVQKGMEEGYEDTEGHGDVFRTVGQLLVFQGETEPLVGVAW
jgi:hypothetical protein